MLLIWWAIELLEPEIAGCHNSLVDVTAKRVDTAIEKARSIAQPYTVIVQLPAVVVGNCDCISLGLAVGCSWSFLLICALHSRERETTGNPAASGLNRLLRGLGDMTVGRDFYTHRSL